MADPKQLEKEKQAAQEQAASAAKLLEQEKQAAAVAREEAAKAKAEAERARAEAERLRARAEAAEEQLDQAGRELASSRSAQAQLEGALEQAAPERYASEEERRAADLEAHLSRLPDPVIVRNNRPRIQTLGTKAGPYPLGPGVNAVPRETFAEAARVKVKVAGADRLLLYDVLMVKHRGEQTPTLEVLLDRDQTPLTFEDLTELREREAKDVVEQTFDRALLARWRAADSRKEVRDAIDAQVAAINKRDEKGTGVASGAAMAHARKTSS